jgi:F-type H+-transporting ATPase subunit b
MADPVVDTHAADAAHGADAAHAAAAGGEHAASFPPFDPSLFPSQIFWFVITFSALYLIVSTFIVPSVSKVLEKRESALKSDLDTAAAAWDRKNGKKVAVLGVGRMGAPMAGHLVDAGHEVRVSDISAEAVALLVKRGAIAAASPAEAAQDADVVCVVVFFTSYRYYK